MTTIGTALTTTATKAMLLGAGELGKEIVFELQALGIEVIAVDNYANAPAQQVSHKSYVIPMQDPVKLKEIILQEKPDYIIPEIEAIATDILLELEQEGFNVVPSAKAVCTTMNREKLRILTSEKLKLPTSKYKFAESLDELQRAVLDIGMPCIVKPIMSSSGRGQSVIKTKSDIAVAWHHAQTDGRTKENRIIVEGFIDFDYEMTLLTVKHKAGTTFLAPIGHTQKNGDYQESWQPHHMDEIVVKKAQNIAKKVTDELTGNGLFGVELFIKGNEVIFNEISPRPHDTGLVTLISQDLSEFALHVRAILGLPIPMQISCIPSASKAIVVSGNSKQIIFNNVEKALDNPQVKIRLFGKGQVSGHRRLGVILAKSDTTEEAISMVIKSHKQLVVSL